VVLCYSPHNASTDHDTVTFYTQRHAAIISVTAHNFITILREFKARTGKEDAPYTYHNITNQNGNLLVKVMLEKNLMAANTHLKKRQNFGLMRTEPH
jgi:hypothetical protein